MVAGGDDDVFFAQPPVYPPRRLPLHPKSRLRQVGLVKLRQKKAQICEIQVNGGDIAAKVDFARGLFEQKVPVDAVFAKVRPKTYFEVRRKRREPQQSDNAPRDSKPRQTGMGVTSVFPTFLAVRSEIICRWSAKRHSGRVVFWVL